MRHHGLEAPLNPLQMASWVLFVLVLAAFFALLCPLLLVDGPALLAALTAALVLSVGGAVAGGLKTSLVDPADPAVLRRERQRAIEEEEGKGKDGGRRGGGQEEEEGPPADDAVFCYICNLHVNACSKHCRYCDKCVDRFDHHCLWLNTCVGRGNYRYFLVTVVSTTFMVSLCCALVVRYLVEFFTDREQFGDRVRKSGSHLSGESTMIVLFLVGGALLPLLLLVYQLFFFHLMLIWKQQTTYDFIIETQKKQREQTKKRQQDKVDKERAKVRKAQEAARRGIPGRGGDDRDGGEGKVEMRTVSAQGDEETGQGAGTTRTGHGRRGGGRRRPEADTERAAAAARAAGAISNSDGGSFYTKDRPQEISLPSTLELSEQPRQRNTPASGAAAEGTKRGGGEDDRATAELPPSTHSTPPPKTKRSTDGEDASYTAIRTPASERAGRHALQATEKREADRAEPASTHNALSSVADTDEERADDDTPDDTPSSLPTAKPQTEGAEGEGVEVDMSQWQLARREEAREAQL